MNTYKVTKSFIDRDSGKYFNFRDTFTSSDVERVSFLAKEGYISNLVDDKQHDDEMTLTNLKTRAKILKIKGYTTMEKDELIKAIESAEQAGD